MNSKTVEDYIRDQYGVTPDFPWGEGEGAVFRHIDNKKWFALIMTVSRDRLGHGIEGEGLVDAMNLKINDPILHDSLTHEPGIIPAYHMNKQHWITVVLDGTVPAEQVFGLIDLSFEATSPRIKRIVNN